MKWDHWLSTDVVWGGALLWILLILVIGLGFFIHGLWRRRHNDENDEPPES